MRLSLGHGSRLLSTIAHSFFPSSIPAIARVDGGKRLLRAFVAFGLKKGVNFAFAFAGSDARQ
jgi:hypothetical protein